LQAQITDTENNKRTIHVDVTLDEMKPYFDASLDMFREQAQIPGFRKGKAPKQMIKTRFASEIEAEALSAMIEEYSKLAVEATKSEIVAIMGIENLQYKKNQPLSFDFTVEILPAYTIANYKGLAVKKIVHEISDKEIEATIDQLRASHATVQERQEVRPDFVVYCDIQVLDASGLPIIGKKYEDRRIPLNTRYVGQELIDGLTGAKPGEMRKVNVTKVNADTQEETTEHYAFLIRKIEEIIIPPLDDEFAKDVGYENTDILRQQVVKKLTAEWENRTNQLLNDRLIDAVIQNNEIPAPEPYIKDSLRNIRENLKQRYKNPNIDESFVEEKYRANAIREVKWTLAKKKIIAAENLKVTDEDKQAYREKLAKAYNVDIETINLNFRDERERKQLEDQLLENKVLALLQSAAVIEEVKESFSEESEAQKPESSLIV